MIEEPKESGHFWIRTNEGKSIVVHADGLWFTPYSDAWLTWKEMVGELEVIAIEPVTPPSWERKP